MTSGDRDGGVVQPSADLPENVHLLADHPGFLAVFDNGHSIADRALACAFIELHYEGRHTEARLLARIFPNLLTQKA